MSSGTDTADRRGWLVRGVPVALCWIGVMPFVALGVLNAIAGGEPDSALGKYWLNNHGTYTETTPALWWAMWVLQRGAIAGVCVSAICGLVALVTHQRYTGWTRATRPRRVFFTALAVIVMGPFAIMLASLLAYGVWTVCRLLYGWAIGAT